MERSRVYVLAVPFAIVTTGCAVEVQPTDTNDPASEETFVAQAAGVSGTLAIGSLLEATDAVNLRAGASTGDAVLTVIPAGGRVLTIERSTPQNGFYRVVYRGRIGWSYGSFYKLVGTPPDAATAKAAPSWSCGKSAVGSKQYWTCNGASDVFACKTGSPQSVHCANGCITVDTGYDDVCSTTPVPPVEVPAFDIVIHGGLFAESAVRKPIEDGLRYEVARVRKYVVGAASKTVPRFTLTYDPWSSSWCGGLAGTNWANLSCPYGYPIAGENQNYVVNITLHEIGHILAEHLIAPPYLRDTCTNEGIASWIAGTYWMNDRVRNVGSLWAAARYEIDTGRAWASMTSCYSANDAWYKVYASYFEYLEQNQPGAIQSVCDGSTAKTAYTGAWRTWLGR